MKENDPINVGNTEPTRAELEILEVLWENGPATVRFVNEVLNAQKRAVQYTSTLKTMQIMADKGFLVRDETNMKHIYSVAVKEQDTKSLMLDRFIDLLFKGSASKLMVEILGNKKTSQEERDKIRAFLDQSQKEE